MDIFEVRAYELERKQWVRWKLSKVEKETFLQDPWEEYQARRIASLRRESQTYGVVGIQEILPEEEGYGYGHPSAASS